MLLHKPTPFKPVRAIIQPDLSIRAAHLLQDRARFFQVLLVYLWITMDAHGIVLRLEIGGRYGAVLLKRRWP